MLEATNVYYQQYTDKKDFIQAEVKVETTGATMNFDDVSDNLCENEDDRNVIDSSMEIDSQ